MEEDEKGEAVKWNRGEQKEITERESIKTIRSCKHGRVEETGDDKAMKEAIIIKQKQRIKPNKKQEM